jgi:plastocyanin
VSGPQAYTIGVDAPSSAGEHLVFGAFFPATIKARPGDAIVFENRSSHDVHTVTFGVKPDRSNAPPNATKAVQANPVVFGPCSTDAEPTRDLEACPGAAGQASGPPTLYAGKGFWNSGALSFPGAPGPAAKAVTVRLAPTIAPGTYPIVCLLHPFMNAQLQVVATDAERLSPATSSAAGDAQVEQVQTEAGAIAEPVDQLPGTTTVAAGWGDRLVSVNRFSPRTTSVKVGGTVTWVDQSSYMPHTISFESPFKGPQDTDAFLPAGVRSGSGYSGGVAHSGTVGPPPEFPSSSFSLKFTRAGSYTYLCILHPGMVGVVDVQ